MSDPDVVFLLGHDLSLAGASTQGDTRGKFFVRPPVMLEFDAKSPGKGITIRFGSAARRHHHGTFSVWDTAAGNAKRPCLR
jgi:hypothetical protein